MKQTDADEYLKMLAQAIDLKGDDFLGQFVEWVIARKIRQVAEALIRSPATDTTAVDRLCAAVERLCEVAPGMYRFEVNYAVTQARAALDAVRAGRRP